MAGVIITSAIKNIPENAIKAVDRAMKGEIPYGTREVFGIAEDAVGIAENEFYEALLSEEDRAENRGVKRTGSCRRNRNDSNYWNYYRESE